MGLKSTDSIMIHSSYKAIGEVEGRAETVVDALMTYFKDGLLMTPTHTWAQFHQEYNVYDPVTEPACVGIIPNLFRKRPGVVRSLHPTHSIAAYGPKAESYIAGDENCTTPCAPQGCWGRLKDVNAYILLLGVTHIRNTYMHSVEEMFDVPNRLTSDTSRFEICMPDGSRKIVDVHKHQKIQGIGISMRYDKLAQAFYENGAARKVTFADADCILCEAEKIYEVMGKVFAHDPECIINLEEIPREWWL